MILNKRNAKKKKVKNELNKTMKRIFHEKRKALKRKQFFKCK